MMQESDDLGGSQEMGNDPMLRVTPSSDSTTSEVLHELDVARWYAIEQMILEERACRTKDIAEIRETLAMVSRQPNFQLASDGLMVEEPQLCFGRTREEGFKVTSLASHANMESFNKLVSDMRQGFVTRLRELEIEFNVQADRHMALFASHQKSMNQEREKVKEVEQVSAAQKRFQAADSEFAKSWKGLPVMRSSPTCKIPETRRAESPMSPTFNLPQSPRLQMRTAFTEPGYTPDHMHECRQAKISITASRQVSSRATLHNYQHHVQIASPSMTARQVFSMEAGPSTPLKALRRMSIP